MVKKAKKQVSGSSSSPVDLKQHISAIPSRDAKMHHLYAHLQTEGGHKVSIDLSSEINSRMRIDHVFEDLVPHTLRDSSEPVLPRNFECLKNSMNTYEKFCGKMSDYDLKYVRNLVHLCEDLPSNEELPSLLSKIEHACNH